MFVITTHSKSTNTNMQRLWLAQLCYKNHLHINTDINKKYFLLIISYVK